MHKLALFSLELSPVNNAVKLKKLSVAMFNALNSVFVGSRVGGAKTKFVAANKLVLRFFVSSN